MIARVHTYGKIDPSRKPAVQHSASKCPVAHQLIQPALPRAAAMFVGLDVQLGCGSADDLPVTPPLGIGRPALFAKLLTDLRKTPAPVMRMMSSIPAVLL